MKIAIIYNRDSKSVINLFGTPNREKIGLKTINRLAGSLRDGGHQVQTFEGDKDLIDKLESFMPRVVAGERPGLAFNVSYGIQGQARYTHVPGILEMIGIPYVGSGPLAHSLALDKVVAKMIFQQSGLPTPLFAVLNEPGFPAPDLPYPLIVKPKNEAVSFGLKVVHDEAELREAADVIFDKFQQPVLAEQFIEGREVNVGLLGNNPPEILPPVELVFDKSGPAVYSYEDKTGRSGREIQWVCPASIGDALIARVQDIAKGAFTALGCLDCARVDMRIDKKGNPLILEINSLPSLGEHGSYVIGAEHAGLDFSKLVNRLVEVAAARYFGTPSPPKITVTGDDIGQQVFSYLVERRDRIERRIREWSMVRSRTADPTGLQEAVKKLSRFTDEMGLRPVRDLSDERAVQTWETRAGVEGGILLVGHIDVPIDLNVPTIPYRRDPEWLQGEGVGTSRAPMVMMEYIFRALRSVRRLHKLPLGVLYYNDEGRDCRYSAKLIREAMGRARRVLVLRPGHVNDKIIIQRRGWQQFQMSVEGSPRRPGGASRQADLIRWSCQRIAALSKLSSRADRIAVAITGLSSESFQGMLPHRAKARVLLSYLDNAAADKTQQEIREILREGHYRVSLEEVSNRPPMRKRKKNEPLVRAMKDVAQAWDIPLETESSLMPSVAGLAPSTASVVCGVGPVARDVHTPQVAVNRISVMQRTLLLAQYLIGQLKR
jgi:D-alanine-D-alanine ligase